MAMFRASITLLGSYQWGNRRFYRYLETAPRLAPDQQTDPDPRKCVKEDSSKRRFWKGKKQKRFVQQMLELNTLEGEPFF